MSEKQMATIYLFGKKYEVPAELTIMNAMEYAGYQLKRGCGCRNGFCGACATIYRIKGENQLQTCLACSKKVEDLKELANSTGSADEKKKQQELIQTQIKVLQAQLAALQRQQAEEAQKKLGKVEGVNSPSDTNQIDIYI